MDAGGGTGGAERSLLSIWRAHGAAACFVAVVLAAYAATVVRPNLERERGLRQEIARLAAQRATLENAQRVDAAPQRLRPQSDALKARELLPSVSLLGRRSGLKIRAIKQAAADEAARERQIRVLARGTFAALVRFLDGIAGVLPQGRVEELTLRQISDATEIELESVVRVRVKESAPLSDARPEVAS